MSRQRRWGWTPVPLGMIKLLEKMAGTAGSPDGCAPSADAARVLAELSPPGSDSSGITEQTILQAMRQPAVTREAAGLVAELVSTINAELQQASRDATPVVKFGVTLSGDNPVRQAARAAFDYAGDCGVRLEHSLRRVAAPGELPDMPNSFKASAELYAASIQGAIDAMSSPAWLGARRYLHTVRLGEITEAHAAARRLVAGATFVDANIRAAGRESGAAEVGDSLAPGLAGQAKVGRRSDSASSIADIAMVLKGYFDKSAEVTSLVHRYLGRYLRKLPEASAPVISKKADRIMTAVATFGMSEVVPQPIDSAELLKALSVLSRCEGVAQAASYHLGVVLAGNRNARTAATAERIYRQVVGADEAAQLAAVRSEEHDNLVRKAAECVRIANRRGDFWEPEFKAAIDELRKIASRGDARSTEAALLATLMKGKVAEVVEMGS